MFSLTVRFPTCLTRHLSNVDCPTIAVTFLGPISSKYGLIVPVDDPEFVDFIKSVSANLDCLVFVLVFDVSVILPLLLLPEFAFTIVAGATLLLPFLVTVAAETKKYKLVSWAITG